MPLLTEQQEVFPESPRRLQKRFAQQINIKVDYKAPPPHLPTPTPIQYYNASSNMA
jgi:hypothetical protein